MPWERYAIVAGHDNQATVVNIETIIPTGDSRAYGPPRGWGNYDPGVERIRGDGSITTAGKKRTRWVFRVVSHYGYAYAVATWEGPVTIYTRTTSSTYSYYNAMCHIPKLTEQQTKRMYLIDFPFDFTDLVAVAAP